MHAKYALQIGVAPRGARRFALGVRLIRLDGFARDAAMLIQQLLHGIEPLAQHRNFSRQLHEKGQHLIDRGVVEEVRSLAPRFTGKPDGFRRDRLVHGSCLPHIDSMTNMYSLKGLRSTLLMVSLWPVALAAVTANADPMLLRYKLATITSSDLRQLAADYDHWLDYKVRERGRVSRSLAAGWGTPRAADRRYILLSSDAAPDVYIRAVEAPAVENYRPLTTYGWNAIEIIVDDPDALRARLRGSPFTVIGEPAPLGSFPTIRAFQVRGRAAEVLYLTAETGDRSKSLLPLPNGSVGRLFIMVVASADIEKQVDWYSQQFAMPRSAVRQRTVGVLQRAQGLAADATLPLTTLRLANAGNLIEFDGYAAGTEPRSAAPGDLPPGIAMASFGVRNLGDLQLDFIRPPGIYRGAAYGGHRSATVLGPAGELVELIEE